MVRIWQRFHPGETLSTIKFTFKVKEYVWNVENNPRFLASEKLSWKGLCGKYLVVWAVLWCHPLYRDYRVPEFLSLRRNWVPPTPSTASECVSLLGPRGERSNTPLRVRGWEDPSRTTGKKAWHSVYSVPFHLHVPRRLSWCKYFCRFYICI
jgi:hypothetical protein